MPWRIAVGLVFAWWVGHQAYHLAPLAYEAHAWNVGQALSSVTLLTMLVLSYRSPIVDVPASFLLAEQLQVIGCTVAYVIKPWQVLPGESKCSAALNLPLGTATSVALIWVCLWLLDKFRESKK